MNPTALHTLRIRTTGRDGLPAPEALADLKALQAMSKTFERVQARFERNRLLYAKRALEKALRSVHARFPTISIEVSHIGYGYQIKADGRVFDRSKTPHYFNGKLSNGFIVAGNTTRRTVEDDLHFALLPALRMLEAFELAGISDHKWKFVKAPRKHAAANLQKVPRGTRKVAH